MSAPEQPPLGGHGFDFDACSLDRDGHPPYRLLRGLKDRLVADFERAVSDPGEAQARVLDRILQEARPTTFGRDHHLEDVKDLEGFRQRVPIAGWDRTEPYVRQVARGEKGVLTRSPVRQLLETSGTTGAAKWIPVTDGYARGVAAAQALWVIGLVREHEALAKGSALTLVSPAEKGRTEGGIPYGSNTGRMHLEQPWWVRFRYPVPYPAYCVPDPETRLYTILRFALQADIRSITTANPTTLLLLCRRLKEWSELLARDLAQGTLVEGPAARLPDATRRALSRKLKKRPPPEDWRPARVWNLATLNCWKGGSAAYFLPLLPEAVGADLPVREVGITASETYLALTLSHTWPGCVAWPQGELQEYVDDEDRVRSLPELETGRTYRVVVSGLHGLYRYDLGDLVEVVGRYRRTPVLAFVRRGGSVLNATGEKVTETQAIRAMEAARARLGLPPLRFLVRIRFAEVPAYEVAVEDAPDVASLALALDANLQEANVEYAEKRSSGRLGPMVALGVPPGTFGRMRDRAVESGTPDGQYKDPILALTGAAWSRLEECAGAGITP